MVEQLVCQLRSLDLIEVFDRVAGDVDEGAAAEVGHNRASLVKRVPETAGPIFANLGGKVGGPFPGKHALARAANRIKKQNGMRVSSQSPVIQNIELCLASDEIVRAKIARLGIQLWRM